MKCQHKSLDANLLEEHKENKKAIIRQHHSKRKDISREIVAQFSPRLQCQVSIISQDGASSWLSTLPLKAYDFVLHKRAFLDAVALRYGWSPDGVPTRCKCGKAFSVVHALNCLKDGFPTLRHKRSGTLRHHFLMKSVTMFVWSHTSNRLLERPSITELLTGMKKLDRTSVLVDSGDRTMRRFIWIYEYLTPMLTPTATSTLRPVLEGKNRRRDANMNRGSEMLCMVPSLHFWGNGQVNCCCV